MKHKPSAIKLTVGCLVLCDDGLVMVQEEQDGAIGWDIPAGGIEVGETPEQAILRELREEIGLSATTIMFRQTYWQRTDDTVIVHFLFETSIQSIEHLNARDADIQGIRSFTRKELEMFLQDRRYEHLLAKLRIESYLGKHPAAYIDCTTEQ